MSNITLKPDSSRYRKLLSSGDQPPALFDIEINRIEITGVSTPRALLEKEISGRKVIIDHPRIEIFQGKKNTEGSNSKVGSPEFYQQLLGDLNMIKMDSVEIRNATIITHSRGNTKRKTEFINASIFLGDLLIDSLSANDSSRILFSKSARFTCDRINYPSDNKMSRYNISTVQGDIINGTLQVRQFDIQPLLSEDAFVKNAGTQKDRVEMHMSGINFTGVNFRTMFDRGFYATNLNSGSSSIKIYRDLNMPRDNKNRTGSYPHQELLQLEQPFYIRKATMNNVLIEYKEKNALSGQTGKIQFANSNIAMSNVTNISSIIAKDNTCEVNVSSSFMNLTPFKARIIFNLGSNNGKFTINGSMGSVSAPALNNVTKPMGMAELKSGQLNSLQFSFAANDHNSNGKLTLLYNGLKIRLLEKDRDEKELDTRRVMSIFANKMIDDDNPQKGEETRVASVNISRNPNRSFFYLIWQSIFTGVKETLGVKNAPK